MNGAIIFQIYFLFECHELNSNSFLGKTIILNLSFCIKSITNEIGERIKIFVATVIMKIISFK